MKKAVWAMMLVFTLLFTVLPTLRMVEFAAANFTVPVQMSSPKNATYTVNQVPLELESIVAAYLWEGWHYGLNSTVIDVCYSLDGKANQSVPFTFTTRGKSPNREAIYTVDLSIEGLADGTHHLTVYLKGETYDIASYHQCSTIGTSGSSSLSPSPTATESNSQPEFFPTALVATASVASITVVGIVLLVYFRNRKKAVD